MKWPPLCSLASPVQYLTYYTGFILIHCEQAFCYYKHNKFKSHLILSYVCVCVFTCDLTTLVVECKVWLLGCMISQLRRSYDSWLNFNGKKAKKLWLLRAVRKTFILTLLLLIPFPNYLQRAVVSFLASGAASGRGRWSRKARPSPSWAPPSSGRSPPPPDRYCCQTPRCQGGSGRSM